jgi:ribonuclease D
LPKPSHSPEGSAAAADILKVLLKLVTEEHGVAAKIVASSDDIDKIASEGDMANVPALHGWRREVFGQKALDLIDGKIGIKFENRRIRAVELGD